MALQPTSLKLLIKGDYLANWLMINNCLADRDHVTHDPEKDYWNGVTIYLNEQFKAYRGGGMTSGVGAVTLKGAGSLETIPASEFAKGHWLSIVLGVPVGMAQPIDPRHGFKFFAGKLNKHTHPLKGGILLWQSRDFPLFLSSEDGGANLGFHNIYTFESKVSSGFELILWNSGGEIVENYSNKGFDTVEVLSTGGGGSCDPTNPPQYPKGP